VSSESSYPALDALPEVAVALRQVEEKILEATRVPDPLNSEIISYLAKAGGKRVRPLLALLGARLGGPISEPAIDAAVAVELIHVGSLYHDDVIDESPTRRGKSSVNANWGNSVAILAGDFVLARASEIGARLGKRASELLARTLGTIVYGQMLELARAYDLDADVDGYMEIVANKTASLISTSLALGGIVAAISEDDIDTLSEYGNRMGVVFQVVDDILDIVGDSQRLGKPVGLDMIEGTYTLPVIYALEVGGDSSKRLAELLDRIRVAKEQHALVRVGDDGGRRYDIPTEIESFVDEARRILLGTGATKRALERALLELQRAHELLRSLGESPVVTVLSGLEQFILGRLPEEGLV